MYKIVAQYTIREIAENGKCRVQYIVNKEVLFEGKEYPQGLYGHPYFCDLVSNTLDIINEKPKANAHLIAAAPDMYEALNSLLKTYEVLTDAPSPDYPLYWVNALKAIAKAEGK